MTETVSPCGGCGETDPNKRCLGCRHEFTPPTPPQNTDGEAVAWKWRYSARYRLKPEDNPWRYMDMCPDWLRDGRAEIEPLFASPPASLLSTLKAERDSLATQVALVSDPAYLATVIDKVGMVDAEWKARAERAKAERDALAKALEETRKPPTKYVPECRQFIADPCGSARCAGCGKYRREHRQGDAP